MFCRLWYQPLEQSRLTFCTAYMYESNPWVRCEHILHTESATLALFMMTGMYRSSCRTAEICTPALEADDEGRCRSSGMTKPGKLRCPHLVQVNLQRGLQFLHGLGHLSMNGLQKILHKLAYIHIHQYPAASTVLSLQLFWQQYSRRCMAASTVCEKAPWSFLDPLPRPWVLSQQLDQLAQITNDAWAFRQAALNSGSNSPGQWPRCEACVEQCISKAREPRKVLDAGVESTPTQSTLTSHREWPRSLTSNCATTSAERYDLP